MPFTRPLFQVRRAHHAIVVSAEQDGRHGKLGEIRWNTNRAEMYFESHRDATGDPVADKAVAGWIDVHRGLLLVALRGTYDPAMTIDAAAIITINQALVACGLEAFGRPGSYGDDF